MYKQYVWFYVYYATNLGPASPEINEIMNFIHVLEYLFDNNMKKNYKSNKSIIITKPKSNKINISKRSFEVLLCMIYWQQKLISLLNINLCSFQNQTISR